MNDHDLRNMLCSLLIWNVVMTVAIILLAFKVDRVSGEIGGVSTFEERFHFFGGAKGNRERTKNAPATYTVRVANG